MRIPALIFVTVAALAQDTSPQFEVASIKPAPPPTGRGMRVSSRGGPGTDDPGIYICENCSISGLVQNAFNIQDYQLTGPDWMKNERFDVSAKIPPGTTKEQFRVMLQNLLAERFKMTFHHSKKEMTAFNLVVSKNGPKFKDYVEPPPNDDAPKQLGPMKKDANGFPLLNPGKGFTMAISNNRAALRTGGGNMDELAENLAAQLRQPVADATGLKGKYDIALTWVPGEPAPDDPGPSIFQALQDQLGLKLESKKTMIDIVVIDHIEKVPAEN